MGKQFAVALAQFNQDQLNAITTDVVTVQGSVATVQGAVDDIKNTNLAALSNNVAGLSTQMNGMNIESEYKPFESMGSFNAAQANVYQSVVNITGVGRLSKAIAMWATTSQLNIRITADGVVVHETGTITSNKATGIADEHLTLYNAAITFYGYSQLFSIDTSEQKYPYTGGGNGFTLIDKPIEFKNSLLVEIKGAVTTTGIVWKAQGGVI